MSSAVFAFLKAEHAASAGAVIFQNIGMREFDVERRRRILRTRDADGHVAAASFKLFGGIVDNCARSRTVAVYFYADRF